MKRKRTIGYSDYSRHVLETNENLFSIGSSPKAVMGIVNAHESNGWRVEFKTSLLRRIFCMARYKIVATKN